MSCCKELTEGAKGLKAGIKDRAIWFHLLVAAAEKQNADIEKLCDDAIFVYGANLYKDRTCETPSEFVHMMLENDWGREVFDQHLIRDEGDFAEAHFYACPLVEAWKAYGLSDERIRFLCDLASKGDFGRASNFPKVEISFPKKVAYGDECCDLVARTVK